MLNIDEIKAATPEQDEALLGEIAAALVVISLKRRTNNGKDRLLKAEAAAKRLGLSVKTIYANASEYPFTVRQGNAVRFSDRGIDRYLEARMGK